MEINTIKRVNTMIHLEVRALKKIIKEMVQSVAFVLEKNK